MNIIKEGTQLPTEERPIRFTCKACGCVFEMAYIELKGWATKFDWNVLYAECPNCKSMACETLMR